MTPDATVHPRTRLLLEASIAVATALADGFGSAALAGYGTAARLEYLLVPLVFGLGAPLVAMVGACIGAGLRECALRATWIGAAIAVTLTQIIGLLAAGFAVSPGRSAGGQRDGQRSGHCERRLVRSVALAVFQALADSCGRFASRKNNEPAPTSPASSVKPA